MRATPDHAYPVTSGGERSGSFSHGSEVPPSSRYQERRGLPALTGLGAAATSCGTEPSWRAKVISEPVPPAEADRLKAPGYAAAPLIETIFGAYFEGGLSGEERLALVEVVKGWYPNQAVSPHYAVKIDVETDDVTVDEPEPTYRLEAEDDTELLLIRPEGIAVSQLAPYKSWEVLKQRFDRDFHAVIKACPGKVVSRLAVRSVNRIDVPFEGRLAHYENYLNVYIKLPDEFPAIGPYSLEFEVDVPEAKSSAIVRSGVVAPAVDGAASFVLDIDLARTQGLPANPEQLIETLNELREPKNRLYRRLLTATALKDFG